MKSECLARKASAAPMACYHELFSRHHLGSAFQPHHSFALGDLLVLLLQKVLQDESLYSKLEAL